MFKTSSKISGKRYSPERGNVTHFGAAMDRKISEDLEVVGEIIGESREGVVFEESLSANVGLRYSFPASGLILDLGLGRNLKGSGSANFNSTLGFTVEF
ncbi:MAG: hypothetical protein ACE5QV_06415 [Fidelibacterota bacterium]